jgi:asparaginyl-tRNA synthetase
MDIISIKEAMKKGTGKVAIRGWVYRKRDSKDTMFIVMRDASGIVQCIVKKGIGEKAWKDAEKLLIESSLVVAGEIKPDKRAPTGFEITADKIDVIHFAETFPITKDQSTEFLLDKRHLWLRSRRMTAILKIRSTVFGAIHEYFRREGFYEFHSPCFTPGVAEEGPTMFKVDYFGKPMYLTQTWQMYAETAIFALEKIYTIAPSFRAEKSKTSRHLTEYWHAEVEAAWYDLDKIMDVGEDLIKFVLAKILEKHKAELEILGRDIKKLDVALSKKWPRITYDHALKELKDKKKMHVKWGKDLRTVEEEKLMELYDTPVFVTMYPKEIMAFYKPRDKKDPRVARCFDLIAPEAMGELIGGSERDIDIEELKKALKSKGEDIKNYDFYLETRRYGSVPHAGFGLGVERLVRWMCGLESIKDAIPFPRTMLRTTP